jgi:hypothetical protein
VVEKVRIRSIDVLIYLTAIPYDRPFSSGGLHVAHDLYYTHAHLTKQ